LFVCLMGVQLKEFEMVFLSGIEGIYYRLQCNVLQVNL